MGTSISHPSPDTSNWKPPRIIYEKEQFPLDRLLKEIWRASENQENPLSEKIGSESIFKCQKIISESKSIGEALRRFRKETLQSKDHSIVAEFAKRSIPAAFKSDTPLETWRTTFFTEITKYIMSRDVSGFVGEKYRNKNINDLNNFKASIGGNISAKLNDIGQKPTTLKEWRGFVNQAVQSFKKVD